MRKRVIHRRTMRGKAAKAILIATGMLMLALLAVPITTTITDTASASRRRRHATDAPIRRTHAVRTSTTAIRFSSCRAGTISRISNRFRLSLPTLSQLPSSVHSPVRRIRACDFLIRLSRSPSSRMATGIRSRYGLLPFSRPNPTVSFSGKRTFHPPMKSRITSVILYPIFKR